MVTSQRAIELPRGILDPRILTKPSLSLLVSASRSEPPACRARSPCTIHPLLTQRASSTLVQAWCNNSVPAAVVGIGRAAVERHGCLARWPRRRAPRRRLGGWQVARQEAPTDTLPGEIVRRLRPCSAAGQLAVRRHAARDERAFERVAAKVASITAIAWLRRSGQRPASCQRSGEDSQRIGCMRTQRCEAVSPIKWVHSRTSAADRCFMPCRAASGSARRRVRVTGRHVISQFASVW